jgi:NADPH2:quinone reductase
MRVVVCREYAPPESLVVEERPSPPLSAGQVRVRVTASGVNFVDGLIVQGRYQVRPPVPFVPGNELAGVVTEVAPDVDGAATGLTVGRRVMGIVGFGGFATEVALPARAFVPAPERLTDTQAAAFMQSYMTAWFALVHRARAGAGERLLVLGAGGGVGLAAVDVGRSLGLRVLAAASSSDKRDLARSKGADACVDTAGDLDEVAARLKDTARAWGGGGVDIVYDPIGGGLAETALRTLVDDGQYLVVGFAAGEIPLLPANHVLLRNRRVTGVDWGGWIGAHQAENRQMLLDLCAAVDRGELHPVEPAVYRFDDVGVALRDQLERRVVGKSVLVA